MKREIRAIISTDIYEELQKRCKMYSCEEGSVIQEALTCFLKNCKKEEMRESMRCGYQEMSTINKEYAELALDIDENELCTYERVLIIPGGGSDNDS
jgi:hypothetical protein